MKLRKSHTRIINSASLEEKKEDPQNNPDYSHLTDEELKRMLYPEMFRDEENSNNTNTKTNYTEPKNTQPKQKAQASQKGAGVKTPNRSKFYDKTYNNKDIYNHTNIPPEGNKSNNNFTGYYADIRDQDEFVTETRREETNTQQNYDDLMIHSRRPLFPGELRYLSDEDRARLTGSNNRGAIYLYNIPDNRMNLHGYALYVFDGEMWRPIPYRNVPVNRYDSLSSRLRTMGYRVGGNLDGFQNWSFGGLSSIAHHNPSAEAVTAASIRIEDRFLPGNLFKLIDTNSISPKEFNFEYYPNMTGHMNNWADVPIDFNVFETIPEFSQISRYAGARGLTATNTTTATMFGIGFAVGISTYLLYMHLKKK